MSGDDRAGAWIRRLDLRPHPEGGHYRETWRSARRVASPGTVRDRTAGTSILYLLGAGERSRIHRIRSEEVWLLHDGGPLTVHVFDGRSGYRELRLALDPADAGAPQAVVPAGAWFGAELAQGAAFALCGCVVAPGFEFADLEWADAHALASEFPGHADVVRRLAAPEEARPD